MKYNSRNIQARIKGRCEEKKSIFIYLKIKKKNKKEVVGVYLRRSWLEKSMGFTIY